MVHLLIIVGFVQKEVVDMMPIVIIRGVDVLILLRHYIGSIMILMDLVLVKKISVYA